MRRILVMLVLIGAISGGGYWYRQQSREGPATLRTAVLNRGELLVTIAATGTIEPEELVDVGAQVAGRIEAFGKDPTGKVVDYNSLVEEGTVLAHIDDSLYAADVEQASAQVDQANANVAKAKADLEQLRARLRQAERNWKRAQELGSSRALSATDYDSYQAAYETALAGLAVGQATVVQTEKAVLQAEAAMKRSRTNLSYCTIKSPVRGVIIDRRVNIGQTVVASLNAPSLFLIAKDLTHLQVWVAVNEADIGNIHPGQPATFRVDAHPGEVFRGTVGKIRLNASMTQNVVTYTVEVNTDNSSGKLRPYLTADVRFEVSRHENALLVPNGALRWAPQSERISPEHRQTGANLQTRRSDGSRPGGTSAKPEEKRAVVWVPDGEFVRPVDVVLGLSDGTNTEITAQALKEGDQVVVGEAARGADGQQTKNPFTPQFFGGGRRG